MQIRPDFELTSVSGRVAPALRLGDPLGPLADLPGTWTGTGFNAIWRPFSQPGQDRFLELNETIEVLEFDRIPGDIPNRGLLQPDINLHGVRYLQQIQDAHVTGPNGKLAGIHIEPGIWLSIPPTTNPLDPATVARLANIPHGTSFVAQGTAFTVEGPPTFVAVNIDPFPIGQPNNINPFPEQNLSVATQFRTPAADIPNITQAMVDNPNSFLAQGTAGKNITETTVAIISTIAANPPSSGGGVDNIGFLVGAPGGPGQAAGGPNAQAADVSAIFWIETIEDPDKGEILQLQYSQLVILNFNGISWPHRSVATLTKTA